MTIPASAVIYTVSYPLEKAIIKKCW